MVSNSYKISIPVLTTDTSEFCKSTSPRILAQKVSQFVNNTIPDRAAIDTYDANEMIKNSFDAFISSGTIKIGTFLDLMVSVKNEGNIWIIKFKDNAAGLGEEKKMIKAEEIKSSKKIKGHFYYGGQGMGLQTINKCIQEQSGSVCLKNRKSGGCTVYIKVPR